MPKHFRQITFHGAGAYLGNTVTTTYDNSTTPWACLREAMATDLSLVEDDLSLIESYWGGDYGDDDGAELVIYDGALIGAINRKLTPNEYATLCAIPHFADVRKTTDAERATNALKIAAE